MNKKPLHDSYPHTFYDKHKETKKVGKYEKKINKISDPKNT